jgi:excisionase family DNA binding protein
MKNNKLNALNELLDTKQLSELLGYKTTYIRNLVQKNKIPFYKPNRKIFLKYSEIIEWIEASKQEVTNEGDFNKKEIQAKANELISTHFGSSINK